MVFERLLYSRLYKAAELDQVLSPYAWCSSYLRSDTHRRPENQHMFIPTHCAAQLNLGILHYRTHSIFLIVVGVAIVLGLWLGF